MRPDVTCYWLTSFERDDAGVFRPSLEELIATARGLGADGVDVKADPLVVDAALVHGLHDAGLEVHVWTVNHSDLAIRMVDLGVDSMTSGRPGVIRTGLESRARNLEPQTSPGR
jgi:glycerophosphoryl diester phosphodiesterase